MSAVAVLWLNDHVLKLHVGGLITGKLSDFAGCFALPLFISALMAPVAPLRLRLGAGSVVTALVFSALKLSQPFSDWLCVLLMRLLPTMGGRALIRADSTDLVALVMVPLAFVWALKRARVLEEKAHAAEQYRSWRRFAGVRLHLHRDQPSVSLLARRANLRGELHLR